MILFFPSQVRPTDGFGGWIGLLAQLPGLVRSIGHQVRRVCSVVVLSGCAWPEKRSGTRRRVFLFSSIASSASSLSFDHVIRARARAMRRDVTTCGVVTTATSTATVTSAGRERMARCGVWVGLSRDRPPHMPPRSSRSSSPLSHQDQTPVLCPPLSRAVSPNKHRFFFFNDARARGAGLLMAWP